MPRTWEWTCPHATTLFDYAKRLAYHAAMSSANKKITLAEAYEKAVSAIPGVSDSIIWNLCRITMRENLAKIFEHEGVDKYGDKYMHIPRNSRG